MLFSRTDLISQNVGNSRLIQLLNRPYFTQSKGGEK
jgi:hypothetical protein